MPEFAFRSYGWSDVCVLVLRGDVDLDAAAELSRTLARLQREGTVFVDLWDVTSIDPICVRLLETSKRRADKARWDFAVIADHGGVAAQAIEAAGLQDVLRPFASKHDARAALRS